MAGRFVGSLVHNEGMTNIPGKRPPDNGPFSTFDITNKGTVLWNLRLWAASVIGVALLLAGFATSRQSPAMLIVWAMFTALWLGWTVAIEFLASPTRVAMVQEDLKPSDRLVTLAPLTPEQQALWGKGKPTRLTPEQQAWVEGERNPPYDHKSGGGTEQAETGPSPKPAEKPQTAAPQSSPKHRAAATTPRTRKRYPPPAPQPYGVDHQGAEVLVAEWMRHLGVSDATATRQVGDGGIDVDSKLFVAQVKHLSGSVGSPDLQRLAGVAVVAGKRGVFFTNTTYSPFAHAFADDARIALFTYDAHEGTLHGVNSLGRAAVAAGDLKRAFAAADSSTGGRSPSSRS